jgi:hypothetical protein
LKSRLEPQSNLSERRPASRRRVLLPGLIVYGNGAYTCDCTFRSLSVSGARIAMTQHLELPERFYLINIRDGLAYDAQLVWRNGAEVGVRFGSTVPLVNNSDLVFGRLKELWMAKVPR